MYGLCMAYVWFMVYVWFMYGLCMAYVWFMKHDDLA